MGSIPVIGHDVVLVVERAEQLTGSGCCGKLEGDNAFHRGVPVFEEARRDQESAGALFQLFCELGPEWSVEIVDPRNMLALWPKLWRHVRHHHPPLPVALRTLSLAFATPALLIDGRVFSSRRLPSRERLEAYLEQMTERPIAWRGDSDGS